MTDETEPSHHLVGVISPSPVDPPETPWALAVHADTAYQTVRNAHQFTIAELARLRTAREQINAEIRQLVDDERQLARMVRIADEARDNDGLA